jgi:hypothetical protein
MDRRDFMKRAAVTSAGVALATAAETALFSRPAFADMGGGPGATFGASVQPVGSQSTTDALLELEHLMQRPFTTVHNRFPWEGSLVNRYSEFIAGRGQIPILSWFTRGRTEVKWSAIAAGQQDARIISEAEKLKAAGWPAYFCFHKEPENEPWLGSAAEWRAAHERMWQIFQDVGVTNATFVPCMMAVTFRGMFGGIRAWLPDHYDILGVDGYNRNVKGNWRTFERIFTPAHELATALAVPMFVIEFGCIEGAPGQKGQWFSDADAVVRSWPEVVGLSYNHEIGHTGNDANMNYRVDTSPSAISSFRTMGASGFFNPAETFYSSKGVSGPTGSGGGSVTPPADTPAADAPSGRTAAERRRHRRHMQRLRARRQHQAAARKKHHRQVNRSGASRAVNRSGVSQSS